MITAGKIINTLKNEGLQCFLDGSRGAIAKHLSDINNADENSLTFYTGKDDSVLKQLAKCIVIVDKDLKTNESELTLIKTNHPKLAFYIIAQFFAPPRPIPGIASTAVIHPSAKIDKSAYIGENSVIENCEIGPNTVIHNNVVVYENSIIGKNVIIESNTCIGATGIIWAYGLDGKMWSLPHLGGVTIGDDCFIGTNITIVRGSLKENTQIGKGCKIAHGSMIGHGCILGENSHLANNIALGGSVVLGERCFLGSGVSIRPKTILGDDVIVGTGAAVVKSFKRNNLILAGVPAKPIEIKKTPFAVPVPLPNIDEDNTKK